MFHFGPARLPLSLVPYLPPVPVAALAAMNASQSDTLVGAISPYRIVCKRRCVLHLLCAEPSGVPFVTQLCPPFRPPFRPPFLHMRYSSVHLWSPLAPVRLSGRSAGRSCRKTRRPTTICCKRYWPCDKAHSSCSRRTRWSLFTTPPLRPWPIAHPGWVRLRAYTRS